MRHYDRHRRSLPWRETDDSYRIWVAEVMLQQTRVETVRPYYERWIERFPTPAALAAADRDEVMAAWSGLGYYARARRLHEAARIVVDRHAGRVPDDPDELRRLPGVGPYTAGAIASIAHGRPVPAIDGNARRVLARLFDLAAPTPAALEALGRRLVPDDRPGDFNQALMELGATICAPRRPACGRCPVAKGCRARARGTIELRPGRRTAAPRPEVAVGTGVALDGAGRALVARRREPGLMGGTWEFPGLPVGSDERPLAAARRALATAAGIEPGGPGRALDPVGHDFTHRRHVYHGFAFDVDGSSPAVPSGADGPWTAVAWVALGALDGRALGAAQRRIADRLVGGPGPPG